MFTITRLSPSAGHSIGWPGEALFSWGFLRMRLKRRPSIQRLPDHLRSDVGLLPRIQGPSDLRDFGW